VIKWAIVPQSTLIDYLSKEGLIQPLPAGLKGELLKSVGGTSIYLDSSRAKNGLFSLDWKVIDNVSKEQLLREIELDPYGGSVSQVGCLV
jgi:predicted transcriptional regulator of viral defense system